MNCSDEHDDHHDHHHDHIPPPDTYASQSLYDNIIRDEIVTLNELEIDMGKNVVKPWGDRLDGVKYLESDVDEQLLINIPFTGIVRLYSLLIRSVADDSAPDSIKLFKNRQDIDFDMASDLQAVAQFEHPQNIGGSEGEAAEEGSEIVNLEAEGIVEYSLNRAHFSNITNLTIFIESNHGNETTKILYIGLRGEWTNVSRGVPAVTLYEAAANPKDHKIDSANQQMMDEA